MAKGKGPFPLPQHISLSPAARPAPFRAPGRAPHLRYLGLGAVEATTRPTRRADPGRRSSPGACPAPHSPVTRMDSSIVPPRARTVGAARAGRGGEPGGQPLASGRASESTSQGERLSATPGGTRRRRAAGDARTRAEGCARSGPRALEGAHPALPRAAAFRTGRCDVTAPPLLGNALRVRMRRAPRSPCAARGARASAARCVGQKWDYNSRRTQRGRAPRGCRAEPRNPRPAGPVSGARFGRPSAQMLARRSAGVRGCSFAREG